MPGAVALAEGQADEIIFFICLTDKLAWLLGQTILSVFTCWFWAV